MVDVPSRYRSCCIRRFSSAAATDERAMSICWAAEVSPETACVRLASSASWASRRFAVAVMTFASAFAMPLSRWKPLNSGKFSETPTFQLETKGIVSPMPPAARDQLCLQLAESVGYHWARCAVSEARAAAKLASAWPTDGAVERASRRSEPVSSVPSRISSDESGMGATAPSMPIVRPRLICAYWRFATAWISCSCELP